MISIEWFSTELRRRWYLSAVFIISVSVNLMKSFLKLSLILVRLLLLLFYDIGPFIFRTTGKVSCVDDNDDNLDLHNILFFSFCTRDKQNFIVKLIVIKLTSIILCFKNLLLNFDLFIIFFEMCFFIKAVWLPHMYFFCKKEIYSAISFIWIFIWKKLFNKV